MEYGMWAPGGMGPQFGGMPSYGFVQQPMPQQRNWRPPPAPCTTTPYVERELRSADNESFSGAALILYRKVDDKLELLLAWERPWNSFNNSFDPVSWNTMGGKRINWQEHRPEATANRCFLEALDVDGLELPSADELSGFQEKAFVAWYPTGKFAIIFCEVSDGKFSDLPAKFVSAKASAGPQEEFKINAAGVKKWTKFIDELEWVPAADLVPEPKKDCSDLLLNVLKVDGVVDFLNGTTDPAKDLPQAEPKKGKGKGKGGGKGGKDGFKGGGKDGKDGKKGKKGGGKNFQKGMAPGPGFGYGMAPAPPPPMPQQMMAPPMETPHGSDAGIQLYGEQLYVLVQPLVPNPYVAQKITGMLLELPQNELMMNLTNREELSRRVTEAMELLKEDGVV